MQIPQFIYEHAALSDNGSLCNILITQPRRLAAVSVAHRVAQEMDQPPPVSQRQTSQLYGGRGRQRKATGLVGYHVRLDAATSKETRLTYCTTGQEETSRRAFMLCCAGILLRLLSGDPLLSNVSHVVVDEVHERTMQSDFLLAVLKDLVVVREEMNCPLKVHHKCALTQAQVEVVEGCVDVCHCGCRDVLQVSWLSSIAYFRKNIPSSSFILGRHL